MTHNPGLPEAIANGCVCATGDNNNGEGISWDVPFGRCFWVEPACPIHGVRLDTELRDAYEINEALSGPNDMEAIG